MFSGWTEESCSKILPATDFGGLVGSSGSDDVRGNARCNRLRELCRRLLCEHFRTTTMVLSDWWLDQYLLRVMPVVHLVVFSRFSLVPEAPMLPFVCSYGFPCFCSLLSPFSSLDSFSIVIFLYITLLRSSPSVPLFWRFVPCFSAWDLSTWQYYSVSHSIR